MIVLFKIQVAWWHTGNQCLLFLYSQNYQLYNTCAPIQWRISESQMSHPICPVKYFATWNGNLIDIISYRFCISFMLFLAVLSFMSTCIVWKRVPWHSKCYLYMTTQLLFFPNQRRLSCHYINWTSLTMNTRQVLACEQVYVASQRQARLRKYLSVILARKLSHRLFFTRKVTTHFLI